MRIAISLLLAIVGLIHLLPIVGVLSAQRLAALYGLPFDDPNLLAAGMLWWLRLR